MDIISLIQAVVLGFIQGITEFLPVSSTGHMVLAEHIFRLDKTLYGLRFDIFTSIGTTAAVIWFFAPDLWHYLRLLRIPSNVKPLNGEEKLPWWIMGITVIVGLTGLLLEDKIETQFRALPYLAAGLILFGIILIIAEKRSVPTPKDSQLKIGQAYAVGLAQICAFIPGVSRSGATISAGMLSGLSRETAARWSFLISVPITTVATLAQLRKLDGITGETLLFYLISMVTAGVTAYYTIHFFMRYVREHSLIGFAYYRFVLAALVLVIAYYGL